MFLNKKSLSLSIEFDKIPLIKFYYTKLPHNHYFCRNLYNITNRYKSIIDNIDNSKKWDQAKKLSNTFELINQTGSKSISRIMPISRSYFKLLEMITDFNLIDTNQNSYKYAAIAEGPGGFIECFINYRKKHFQGRNDTIQCITLKSDSNEVPNWNKAKRIFKTNNVKVNYGKDNTGNIYNTENIKYFRNSFGNNTADLVTADGGFDYSVDFNKQEIMTCRLLFSEILSALSLNKVGGIFILKLFDIYTIITVKLLYLLNVYYDEVIITKPYTSRPANSEKYIICKGFRGIPESNLEYLYSMLEEWNMQNKKGLYLSDISGLEISYNYILEIYKLNLYLANKQLINILKTTLFIKKNVSSDSILYLKKCQTIYAIEWCKKYKNSLNMNCSFLH